MPAIDKMGLTHVPIRCEEDLLNLQQAPFAGGDFATQLDGSLVAGVGEALGRLLSSAWLLS
jgi:hypothetical protein